MDWLIEEVAEIPSSPSEQVHHTLRAGFPGIRQKETIMTNIVLVHGAWADGSSWSGVIQRLQAAGYNVVAPQLPQTSLGDDVARVRQVLSNQSGSTLLVAHSYGGEVISAL